MTGSWAVQGVKAHEYKKFKVRDEAWPPRFTKLELVFGETRLAFCDPRRLGRLWLRTGDPFAQAPWSALAPDPITDPISVETAERVFATKGCTIKSLLLDQQALVAGVGNWIADEVLYQARVHPEAACSSLSRAQVIAVHGSLLGIVRLAVSVGADSSQFPKDWLFHYRWGKGQSGAGAVHEVPGVGRIKFIDVGGRTTAFLPSLQLKGAAHATAKSSKRACAPATEPKKGKAAPPNAARLGREAKRAKP